MNAQFPRCFRGFLHLTVCLMAALSVGNIALVTSASAQTPEGVALDRIVTEIHELHRLVFLLKRDEARARTECNAVVKYRNNAQHFVNGGRDVLFRTGFRALVQKYAHSPEQSRMLQMHVPALAADDFVPAPVSSFVGGDVSQLVEFCRRNNLSVCFGSRAQLVLAELARDLIHKADEQVAELNDRIELYKAQNIAHTDLIGKLMLCARHCHCCDTCYHRGYGCCGCVPPLPVYHPIAGLNSTAYDISRTARSERSGKSRSVATDHGRLRFLAHRRRVGGSFSGHH